MCLGNIQIEGNAIIMGHPLLDGNIDVSKTFKEKHEFFYSRFAHHKSAVFIQVETTKYVLRKFENNKDSFDCFDIKNRKLIGKDNYTDFLSRMT